MMPAHRVAPPTPNTVPLGGLPLAGAVLAIEQLLEFARDAGLRVNERIKPEVWVQILPDLTYDALEAAVVQLARSKPGGWLSVPGDLLAMVSDPDLAIWEAIEREVDVRGPCELVRIPGYTVRHYLAALDCGSLAFDLAHAEHPLERKRLREAFLAACRTPRPQSPDLLSAPALPYREQLRAAAHQRMIEAHAPHLLPGSA